MSQFSLSEITELRELMQRPVMVKVMEAVKISFLREPALPKETLLTAELVQVNAARAHHLALGASAACDRLLNLSILPKGPIASYDPRQEAYSAEYIDPENFKRLQELESKSNSPS